MTAISRPHCRGNWPTRFARGGGKVDFRVLAAYGSEGHWLAETDGGVKIAAPELDRALKALPPAAAKKR